MKRVLALVAGILFACAVPALAVDRTQGAAVSRPAASGAPWTDAQIAALAANANVALGAAAFSGAHVGLLAIDARDGRVLFGRAADDLFQPASTLKLVVGSAAVERLGPAQRFHTEAFITGPVSDGIVQGSLVVRAGGDPFLERADFDALAAALVARGIRGVRDNVAFDVSRYAGEGYSPGWSWDDFAYDYAPVVGALAYEGNALHLTVAPGDTVGSLARVDDPLHLSQHHAIEGCNFPALPAVANSTVTGAASAPDTLAVERTRLGCILLSGAVPLGAQPEPVDAAVPFPTAYARYALRDALQRHGVSPGTLFALSGVDLGLAVLPPEAAAVWSHDSEPLGDTLADMWLPSSNLVAEMLVRELGVPRDGSPATLAAGIAAEKAWLTSLGVNVARVALEDGSGLSVYDRISPRDIVTVLKHDWDGPSRDLILDDLPVAGVRGTLRDAYRGTPLEGRMFAKTGTLSHVSALAGYLATAKHGTVIFAFDVDDWIGDAAALRAARARTLAAIVEN